ncbi:MAG: alpha/beta hydrolase, partial [Actinobacteria bacterium]|nr:alpha/beta hydrolase [Actinomycetota bacterium]
DGSEDPGITLAVHELGEGPAVVFCHGFPELAFSWRHQLPALAAAGFRAIAPDQRGYGASDRPDAIAAYDMQHLTGDLVALLDALGIPRAVFVGHDWGGFVAWAMPVLHPERCAGVIGVNTPYLPRSAVPPTQLMRMLVGGRDERLYILWFQKPGVADDVLARDVRRVFDVLMRRAIPPEELMARHAASGELDMNPFRRLAEVELTGDPFLTRDEMDVYVRAFERTGFTGALHWYRNFDRNWETAPAVGAVKIGVPALMVTAQWDPVLRPEMAAGMPALVPDLETVMIERCGHWTQQEKPDELNRILVDWLGRRFRPSQA